MMFSIYSLESSVNSEIFSRQRTRWVVRFPFWTSLQAVPLLRPFPTRVGFKVFTSISQRKCNCFSRGWLARTAGNQKVWHVVDVLQEPAGGAPEMDPRSTRRLRHLSPTRLIGPRHVPEPRWVTASEDLRRNRSTLTLFRIHSALCYFIAPHTKAARVKPNKLPWALPRTVAH